MSNTTTRNGVDTATCSRPSTPSGSARAAASSSSAPNQWVDGTHSRSTIPDFFGVGEERPRAHVGLRRRPSRLSSSARTTARLPSSSSCTPWPLASPAGLANIAAARKVNLTEVRSTVTGDIDLNGILGLDAGAQRLPTGLGPIHRQGDAPEHVLRQIVEQSRRRSAVYDVITNCYGQNGK